METSAKILVIYKKRQSVPGFIQSFIDARNQAFKAELGTTWGLIKPIMEAVLKVDLGFKVHEFDAQKAHIVNTEEMCLNDLIIIDNVEAVESLSLRAIRAKVGMRTTMELCRYEDAPFIIGSQPPGTYRKTILLSSTTEGDPFYVDDEVISYMAERYRQSESSEKIWA